MRARDQAGVRVLVRGAGIVGLAVADELARRGHPVRVVDPSPGSGASYAAAGMLSPSAEVWWGEETLLDLGVRSAEEWPAWAARLGVDLRPRGTLLVGHDHGDLQQVERQASLLAALGRSAEPWTAAEVRRHEPALGRVAGGLHLPDDHAVDPRAVVAALRARVPVASTVPDGFRPEVEVVATGALLPAPWTPLVRGVRGEVLRLRTDDPPERVVRGWVRGEPVYVVPRGPGSPGVPGRRGPAAAPVEVVVGATSEEHDAPPVVTAGGVLRLLDAARTLLPGLERAELVEATARDRPATPDHLPLVGPAPGATGPTGRAGADGPRVLLAAGMFRHGVLLAPLVARLVADQVEHAAPPEPALDPRRFAHLLAPTDQTPTEGDTRAPARAQR